MKIRLVKKVVCAAHRYPKEVRGRAGRQLWRKWKEIDRELVPAEVRAEGQALGYRMRTLMSDLSLAKAAETYDNDTSAMQESLQERYDEAKDAYRQWYSETADARDASKDAYERFLAVLNHLGYLESEMRGDTLVRRFHPFKTCTPYVGGPWSLRSCPRAAWGEVRWL